MQTASKRPTGEPRIIAGTRQRLGRRLGLEPYYTVVERSDDVLRLVSRPKANQGGALPILVGGAALLLVAVFVAGTGLATAASGAGFAVAGLAAVVAGLFSVLGYQRLVGGYAVLTTHNTIVCDREASAITFRQGGKVGVERAQSLRFSQIGGLRLRRRPLATGWPLRQVRPIIALELVVGDEAWVVDTAVDPEALRPVAEALSVILQLEFARA